jgi:hypothetical protein
MDHRKIYEQIIAKAKSENRKKKNGYYYENHHILPKCLGGLDVKDNLVLLTPKEHFICHKLLTYIYPKNLGIVYAFRLMIKMPMYKASSRDYAHAKELYAAIPAKEKTKEKRLEIWYEINCSPKAIDKYLDSLKNVRCGQADLIKLHIPLKH